MLHTRHVEAVLRAVSTRSTHGGRKSLEPTRKEHAKRVGGAPACA